MGLTVGSEETKANGLLDGLKIVAQNSEAKDRAERLAVGQAPVVFDTADSPACTDCGSIMVRNGVLLQVHQLRRDQRLQLERRTERGEDADGR